MKTNLSAEHGKYLKSKKRKAVFVRFMQFSLLVLFLALWETLTAFEVLDGFITSSPSRVWKTFVELCRNGSLIGHIWASTWETVVGFVAGTLLGVLIATLLWWNDTAKRILEPYLVVLNALPKIALGPLIIIWVGTGKASIITMAILISVVITAINMLAGFAETDKDKILLMKSFSATKGQIFLKLVMPQNVPTILSTLKINVGMSWVGTITGEYLVSREGLGYLIVYGSQVLRLDLVMTCTITLCVLAGAMYGLVALLEKAVTLRS